MFEQIIYQTTRHIRLEAKIAIASLAIFCRMKDDRLYAEFMYREDFVGFLEKLSCEYRQIKFNLDMSIPENAEAIGLTRKALREKDDETGYYKALYEGDEFALAIAQIVDNVKVMEKVGLMKLLNPK